MPITSQDQLLNAIPPESKVWRPATCCALITLAVTLSLAPILILGIPNGPDLPSHLRFAQAFAASIHQGNLHPAWQHEANAGYGDGSFRIYSPLSYYLIFMTTQVTRDWFTSLKMMFWVLSFAGACAVFYWVRGWGNTRQATLAAMIFCCAPFRLNEIYQAALLPEFAGAALLAWLLGLTERFAITGASRKQRVIWQLQFALASGALVFAHIPLAMMAVFVVPLYALLRFDKSVKLERLRDLALASLLGALLSAFYWVNLLRELPLLKGATIQSGVRFDFRQNFAFALSGSLSGWYVNLLFLITFALMVPAFLVLVTSRNLLPRPQVKALLAVTVVSLFTLLMVTPLSLPLWLVVPKLSLMEFPWRWLSVSSILASGITGFSLPLLWSAVLTANGQRLNPVPANAEGEVVSQQRSRARLRLLLAIGTLMVVISFSLAYPVRNALFLNREQFRAALETSKSSSGLEEWLPRWTNANALEAQQRIPGAVTVAGRTVSIHSWLSESRQFTVGEGDSAVARVRTLFYPYWRLQTSAGIAVPTHPDTNGVLLADIPSGPQTIEMKFIPPLHQYVGDALSILGLFSLALLGIVSVRRKKPLSFA